MSRGGRGSDLSAVTVEDLVVRTFRFPTPQPEADGTFEWSATTAVTVEVSAGGETGLGWTYSSPAAATVVDVQLREVVVGRPPDAAAAWSAMRRTCRDVGTRGLAMQAISAVDIALWDLRPGSRASRCAPSSGRCGPTSRCTAGAGSPRTTTRPSPLRSPAGPTPGAVR